MARILVQATLPHSRPKTHEFERVNGRFTLYMNAPPSVGLPYGSYPRLALAWLESDAQGVALRAATRSSGDGWSAPVDVSRGTPRHAWAPDLVATGSGRYMAIPAARVHAMHHDLVTTPECWPAAHIFGPGRPEEPGKAAGP